MADLVDRAYLELDGEVIDCDKIDWDVDGAKSPREAMNKKNRAIGHKRGVPKISINASFGKNMDLEKKFLKMLVDHEIFSTVIEYESQAGESEIITFLDCAIYKVSESSQDGGVDVSLDIGALDFVIT
jgi:hypothetical protein